MTALRHHIGTEWLVNAKVNEDNTFSPSTLLGCSEGCLQCGHTWKENCKACRPGFQLFGDDCYPIGKPNCISVKNNLCEKCAVGYILNSETGSCVPCQDTNCGACIYMTPFSCHSCKPEFYLKSDRTCGACDDNACLSCSGAGQNQCLACKQGFILANSACIPCDVASCATCDASQKCSACKSGYYLDSQNNKCKYCGDGSSSPIGATSFNQCECKNNSPIFYHFF